MLGTAVRQVPVIGGQDISPPVGSHAFVSMSVLSGIWTYCSLSPPSHHGLCFCLHSQCLWKQSQGRPRQTALAPGKCHVLCHLRGAPTILHSWNCGASEPQAGSPDRLRGSLHGVSVRIRRVWSHHLLRVLTAMAPTTAWPRAMCTGACQVPPTLTLVPFRL